MARQSQSSKAGIVFPIARIRRYMKKSAPKKRVSKIMPVYLSAVLEYLCVEIMELAGNVARQCNKRRIIPRHIFLAIANDEELHSLLHNVTISQGGVIPRIHPQLIKIQKPKTASPPTTDVTKVSVAKPKMQPIRKPKPKAKPVPKVTPIKKPKAKPIGKRAPKASGVKAAKKLIPKQSSPMKEKNIQDTNVAMPGVKVLCEKKLFLGQKLIVLQGSLVKVSADAVVHPTDASFSTAGQIGQSFEEAGGDKFKQSVAQTRTEQGPLKASDAVASAFHLFNTKFIIHCNGPTTKDFDPTKLEKTFQSCLRVANDKSCKSIALPLIGTGRGGLSPEVVSEILLKTISNYFVSVASSSLTTLYLVLFDNKFTKGVLKKIHEM